jgi:protein pelota
MKLIRFHEDTGTLKVRVDNLEDLWALQRVIFADDIVKAESERKFKPEEGSEGEFKTVMITLRVEKTELDKSAGRLRILGKIMEGKPLEYVRLNSYHTLNIAPDTELSISKSKWHGYLIDVVKEAVMESKRPRLGIVVVDDEKALPAYILGYGIEFRKEMYSNLSKRMSQKDFHEQERKYFDEILDVVSRMNVDTIVVAGPGFTKDDIKAYAAESGVLKKTNKSIVFESASNAERSGIYELIKSERVARLMQRERISREFALMEQFLRGLESGTSKYGKESVSMAIDDSEAGIILVNDSTLWDKDTEKVLEKAEKRRLTIEVFNSDDEAGAQLSGFKGVASIR